MFPRLFRPGVFLLVASLVIALAACGSNDKASSSAVGPGTTGEVVALTVECTTAYRDEAREPLSTGMVTLSSAVPETEIELGTLKFGAIYYSGERSGEGRFLKISLTTSDGEPLSEHLYQMLKTELPANEFSGGHGFTGLAYMYDPSSQTEVQYWCTAS